MKTAVLASTIALAGCAGTEGKLIADATTADHKCLAEAIYYEAGSEPTVGKHAVAHVVINRSRSGRYPGSICGVVYQRNYKSRGCQFSWSCRRHAAPVGVRWQEAQDVATQVINGNSQDPTKGALNFHGRKERPGYSTRKYQKTTQIGGHVFWKPKWAMAFDRRGE